MAKAFSELRAELTPDAQARAHELTQSQLRADALAGNREDFDRFLTLVEKGKPIAGDEIRGKKEQ
jgi:phosphomannomutase